MQSKSKPFYVNGVTMSHNTLPTVAELSGEMRERLAKVKYVFTDLDATMLAPGSCVLRDNDGNPSTKLVEAVVALARAGIQVVPTSGRNRTMIHEDARVLGLNSYIGEMGGLVMYDLKANDWEYLTGDMPYDPACGLTPHQVIEQTGVCEKILARWPHKIAMPKSFRDFERLVEFDTIKPRASGPTTLVIPMPAKCSARASVMALSASGLPKSGVMSLKMTPGSG